MNIEIYIKKLRQGFNKDEILSLKEIIQVFESLRVNYETNDVLSQLIYIYLYSLIGDPDNRKRKLTARVFEDFLAKLLNGQVTDSTSRANVIPTNLNIVDPYLVKYVVSNRREKIDILLNNDYGVSVKTSVIDNKEINMGSFAREALFKDFLSKEEYGSERKGGLGSKPQMVSTLNLIKQKGLYSEFLIRFEFMVKNIYIDDFIFVMKGSNFIDWYFLEAEKLQNILISAVTISPEKAVSVLNRYEGNSLRIDRTDVLKESVKIRFDFENIKNLDTYKIVKELEKFSDNIILNLINHNTLDIDKEVLLIKKFLSQTHPF